MTKRRTYRQTFIRDWRLYRGLSQRELAKRINKTAGLICQLENSRTGYAQETLEDIAGVLDCDPVDLISRRPGEGEEILPLWDSVPDSKRDQALAIIKTFTRADQS